MKSATSKTGASIVGASIAGATSKAGASIAGATSKAGASIAGATSRATPPGATSKAGPPGATSKLGAPRTAPLIRRGPPEISIEWLDVTIEIRVCGLDLPPEERGYTALFPTLDEKLISSDVIDLRRAAAREKRKVPGYKYEPLPAAGPEELVHKSTGRTGEDFWASRENTPKVLPKLTCRHCGKTFSRKSTLDQHLVSHSSERWADVQDAANKDLEQAIAYSGGEQNYKGAGGEEEQEVSPPPEVKGQEKEDKGEESASSHRCNKCHKSFSRMSLLNRHMKLHSGVKPFSCDVCGWRFLQRYNLKKHMMTHSPSKSNKCEECEDSFSDATQLKNHMKKQHSQGPSSEAMVADKEAPEEEKLQVQDGLSGVILPAGVEGIIPCPKCDRTFAAKAHLERHMPVHTTMVKPYSCVVCGWRFHLLHNMQRHLATHKTKDKMQNEDSKDGDHEEKMEEEGEGEMKD